MTNKDKKALYESIMMDIAKHVKKAINKNLNEYYVFDDADDEPYYDDDYFSERGFDVHNMDFYLSQTNSHQRERIIVDITEVVDDNPEDYEDELYNLRDEVKELVPNVVMTKPQINTLPKTHLDYITFSCAKSDMPAVKAAVRNAGYKVISTTTAYNLGIRVKSSHPLGGRPRKF